MPAIFIDSDRRRIYEVPGVAHTVTLDGGGYRRYTPTVAAPIRTTYGLLQDIYSEWVRDRADNDSDYAPLAFRQAAGDTNMYLRNDLGWRIVPANYAHEMRVLGNLEAQDPLLSLFDVAPLTALGAYPYVRSAAEYLLIKTGDSGLTSEEAAKLDQAALALPASGYTAPPSAASVASAVWGATIAGAGVASSVLRGAYAVLRGRATLPSGDGAYAFRDTSDTVAESGAITGTARTPTP